MMCYRCWLRPAANALKSGRYYIISCNNLQADQGKCITFVQNEMIMSKVDKYVALIPRIQSVLSGETDEIDRDYLEQIVSMLYGKESQRG